MGWGRYAIVIAVTAVLLAGCGGDSDSEESAPAPGATATEQGASGEPGQQTGGTGDGEDPANADAGAGAGSPQTDGVERRAAKRRAERERTNGNQERKRGKRRKGAPETADGNAGSPQAVIQPDTSKSGAERYTGTARSFYENAKLICGSGESPTTVARDLGLSSTDPPRLAAEHAQGYPPKFRRAAAEGCEAGLE